MADIQIDPGFEFRRQQAQKALEASAAAHGGALGGGNIGAILGLNSNLASQEYQSAFQRFQTSTQNRFNNLNTVAGRGAQVGESQGQNLIGGAKYGADLNYRSADDAANFNNNATLIAGRNSIEGTRDVNDYLTGGAQARGAGIVGKTNSIVGGVNGATNAFSQYALTRNYLKNPGTNYGNSRGTVRGY